MDRVPPFAWPGWPDWQPGAPARVNLLARCRLWLRRQGPLDEREGGPARGRRCLAAVLGDEEDFVAGDAVDTTRRRAAVLRAADELFRLCEEAGDDPRPDAAPPELAGATPGEVDARLEAAVLAWRRERGPLPAAVLRGFLAAHERALGPPDPADAVRRERATAHRAVGLWLLHGEGGVLDVEE